MSVAKKMGYVAACIRILEDFSPESLSGSGACMTNTIPQRTIPDTLDFVHKLGVFFPIVIEDFNDCGGMALRDVSTAGD